MEEDDEVTLDDVRDFLYVALRAQERFTQNLRVLVEDLDKRKDDEEWLEQAQDEASKGAMFYDSQLQSWQGFSAKVETYVAAVRKEADELAIEELQINKSAISEENPEGSSRRKAKTIHPELKKFKLEKQARILGKYGGVPAMGAGMVMSLPPRDAILKATASPAAREIQYSKIEDKDARHLAEVMQFKSRKMRASGSQGGNGQVDMGLGEEPEKSPWQAEVLERKGQQYFAEHEAPAQASTAVHTPYAQELAAKLVQQQQALAAAEAAAAAPKRPDGATPSIGSATSELADKLKRQQVSLKVSEEAEARAVKAAAEEAAEAANPTMPTTTWSNAASPFGQELSAALQQRQQQQRAAATPAAAAGTSTPIVGQRAGAPSSRSTPAAESSPGFSFRTASTAIAGAGTPGTPPALRRPPAGVATPAAGAATNELAEVLRRRAEARQAAEAQGTPQ